MSYSDDISIWMPEFVNEVRKSTQKLWLEATMLNSLASQLEQENAVSGAGGRFFTGHYSPVSGKPLYGYASRGVVVRKGGAGPGGARKY